MDPAVKAVRFLPGEVVNCPDFSPVVLLAIWEGNATREVEKQIEGHQRDLILLDSVTEEFLSHRSDSLPTGLVAPLQAYRNHIAQVVQCYETIIGNLDREGKIREFELNSCLARTERYFRKTGVLPKRVDACIWAAASAIEVGNVHPSVFKVSGSTEISRFYRDHSNGIAAKARNRLYEQVSGRCDRYLQRLAEVCPEPRAWALTLHTLERDSPGFSASFYAKAFTAFMEAECGYYQINDWDRKQDFSEWFGPEK